MSEHSSPSTSVSSWDLFRSPFASILGTNHPPSAEELSDLKGHLVEPRIQLSTLESEIDRVQALLSRIQSERDQLRAYVDAHEALVSPIRRLPPETLGAIFIQCLPTGSYPVRSLKEAPLLLTSICRSWRQTAINTPQMWTSLHVFLPDSLSEESFARRQAWVAAWLERSGKLPLSISCCVQVDRARRSTIEAAKTRAVSLVQTLMRFGDRVNDLALAIPVEFLSTLESALPENIPSLNSLNVQPIGYTTRDAASLLFLPLLNRAPALQKFGISNLLTSTSAAEYLALPCAWGNLTELSLYTVGLVWYTDEILQLFAQTSGLRSCKLSFDVAQTRGTLAGVQLDFLQDMRISLRNASVNPNPNFITEIFNNMSCPSLTSLSCSWTGPTLTECPFVTLPLHRLDSLQLSMTMTSQALSQCLSHVPNITFLEICDLGLPISGGGSEYILQDSHLLHSEPIESNVAAAPSGFCPKLETFRIYVAWAPTGGDSISCAALATFLEGRAAMRCCEVFMASTASPTDNAVARLRALKDGGLKLRIRSSPPRTLDEKDLPSAGLAELYPECNYMEQLMKRNAAAIDVV